MKTSPAEINTSNVPVIHNNNNNNNNVWLVVKHTPIHTIAGIGIVKFIVSPPSTTSHSFSLSRRMDTYHRPPPSARTHNWKENLWQTMDLCNMCLCNCIVIYLSYPGFLLRIGFILWLCVMQTQPKMERKKKIRQSHFICNLFSFSHFNNFLLRINSLFSLYHVRTRRKQKVGVTTTARFFFSFFNDG